MMVPKFRVLRPEDDVSVLNTVAYSELAGNLEKTQALTFHAWGHKSRQQDGLISEPFGYDLPDDFRSTATVRLSQGFGLNHALFQHHIW